MTLRDELAHNLSIVGDETGYVLADEVLEILLKYSPGGLDYELTQVWRELRTNG